MKLKLSDWASVAEIMSGIAVVVTLIFLILGIRANTDAQLAASRQTSVLADVTLIGAIIGNPEVNESLMKPLSELSFSEQEQAGNAMAGLVRTREFAWSQYQNGAMDKATMDSYMGTLVRWIEAGEVGRFYWELFAQEINPEFVSHVEALFDGAN